MILGLKSERQPDLEVLIPTFGRTRGAIKAMRSILACADQRIGIRCNSNGRDDTLEEFCLSDSRIAYDYFPENRGPAASVYKLYRESEARFCMLLSDEDELIGSNVPAFLDFLDNLDINCNVISCSIWEEHTATYYRDPKVLNEVPLNLPHFQPFNDTYMSGYVFRVSELHNIDLAKQMGLPSPVHTRHAYGHLDAQSLLTSGSFRVHSPTIVMKEHRYQRVVMPSCIERRCTRQ